MEPMPLSRDAQYRGTTVCLQCGTRRTVTLCQPCPHLLVRVWEQRATITCRCGARLQAVYDVRRHPHQAVQLRGACVAPEAGAHIRARVITSWSGQGLGFVLVRTVRLQMGEHDTTGLRFDGAQQSCLHAPLGLRPLQGHPVGAELSPAEQDHYALDFSGYGRHPLPPPHPAPIRLQHSHEAAAHHRPLGRAQWSAPVARAVLGTTSSSPRPGRYQPLLSERTPPMPEPQLTPRCPHCGSPFVRGTRPKAPNEYLLQFLQRSPCQCQVCARRFTVYHAGRQERGAACDRRHFDRLVTRIPVTCWHAHGGEAGGGMVTNLSLAGCQLHTRTPVAVGAPLRLALHPTDAARAIVVEHAVVRSVHPPAVGVHFVRFAAGARARLSQLVRTLLIAQRPAA